MDKNNQDIDDFKPVKNHINPNAAHEGEMFETYTEEALYVANKAITDPNNVWTIIEGDDNTWYVPGWHFVNRVGYIITELPWQDGQEDIPWETEDDYA